MAEMNSLPPMPGVQKRNWTLAIAGTAAVLLAAGVAIQVMKPTGAHSEDGSGKAPAARPAGSSEKVVATIKTGGSVDKVTYDDLAKECVARYGAEILDNLINRRIIQQACDQHGITVSEAEVKGEVNRIAKKFGLDEENWLKMLQAERNVTPAQYYNDIIWPMLALRKLAGETVEISDKELKLAFDRNYGPRVKARAIVLDNPRRAREVHAKVVANPEDFAKYVTEYSIDPNSRALGGVIPPIPRHAGNEKLEDVVFKLKENEISSVVQVGVNQYMIVLCEGRTEQVVTEMTSDVETMLRDQLTEEKVQQSVAKVFENLKEGARVENILTGTVQGGEKKPAAAARNGAVKPAAGAAGKSAGDVKGVSGEVEGKPAPRAAAKPKAPATK
ncbi:MAG: peptidylprolyl isomerase [Planctomycetaceae bacterium]|jgi:foldase protein PrsA